MRTETQVELGAGIARAAESLPEDLNMQIWGTGGMRYQLLGSWGGLINAEWDNRFLDLLSADDDGQLRAIPYIEYLCETGSEGIEMVMCLIMRGALGRKVTPLHRHYHVPASNRAVGYLVLRPSDS